MLWDRNRRNKRRRGSEQTMKQLSKRNLINYFRVGGRVKIVSPPSHKFYNIDRIAEKIQTNGLMFSGGSWLYFKDILTENIFSFQGFKIDSEDIEINNGEKIFIYYSLQDIDLLINEVLNGG